MAQDEYREISAEEAETAEMDGGAQESAETQAQTEERMPDEAAIPPAWQGADIADKLSYAATLFGLPEDALVEELLRHSGDDGSRWQTHLDVRRQNAREGLTERLTAEFDELSAQVPEIRQVKDVPAEVLETAMSEGVTLLDAYLRRWYAAARKTAEQQERQRQSAAQSAGSLGGVFDEPDPRETAFSRSFRVALA